MLIILVGGQRRTAATNTGVHRRTRRRTPADSVRRQCTPVSAACPPPVRRCVRRCPPVFGANFTGNGQLSAGSFAGNGHLKECHPSCFVRSFFHTPKCTRCSDTLPPPPPSAVKLVKIGNMAYMSSGRTNCGSQLRFADGNWLSVTLRLPINVIRCAVDTALRALLY